jgi:CBS domain-containing protein
MAILIKDIMSTNVITVDARESVKAAIELFQKHRIHHLPVIIDNKKVVRIISSNDIFIHEQGSTLSGEVMNSNITYIDTLATLEDTLDIFSNNNFHSLPVIDKNKCLVGIITTQDLIQLLKKALPVP